MRRNKKNEVVVVEKEKKPFWTPKKKEVGKALLLTAATGLVGGFCMVCGNKAANGMFNKIGSNKK